MEIPIFPLNGAVLFPGTSLPLNIFEKRYIEMVDYSLSKKRLIGMIQIDENGELYKIGCVGKINSFNETADGRYLISLQGISCFRVLSELISKKKFRIVDSDIIENDNSRHIFKKDQKKLLLEKYTNYTKFKNINLNIEEIENIEIEQLIKFIAMISPFNNVDKQVLLETVDLKEFYNKLESIIELELIDNFDSKVIN